jgi:hypothetical protein
MKAANLVQQLQSTLPLYTSLFSDIFSISSLTRSGTTVTAVTTMPHGLITGATIVISGALTPITITSLTQSAGVATALTSSAHDFTDNYTTTVNIFGANQPEYNGIHNFIHQENRKTFTYEITGNPVSPATGTNIYVLENLKHGYNGAHVITRIDDVTFTYQITSTPASPALGTIILSSANRISATVSVERAKESYTPQTFNKLWLFIVLGSSSASKDRFVLTDNTAVVTAGQDYRQRIIDNISLYVFANSENETSGAVVRDLMQDLLNPILKSVLRYHFPSGFNDQTNFGITFAGHDIYEYNYPYYIHQYIFEDTFDITYPDTLNTDDSVAFRDIELNFLNKMNVVIADTNVDLDDVPLP